MNKDCHGTSYLIENVLYWRCLLDGKIMPQDALMFAPFSDQKCPNCRRRAINVTVTLVAKTRTVKQAFLPDLGWETYPTEIK